MRYKQKPEEIAFNRRYSRFKLVMYFKHRDPITHYGQELYGCTVKQIQFRYITQVVLDRRKGLEDCVDRIKLCEQLYGEYETAMIFDKLHPTKSPTGMVLTGREIQKYIKGRLVEWVQAELQPYEYRVVTNVIYDDKGFHLKPVQRPVSVDFKAEVTRAISNHKK